MATISSNSENPILLGPTDKEKKYDRQLRLWAAKGQDALETSDILLINSGSGVVGVETVKNLVLPGAGKFTIIDDATVCEADLGVNFFLDRSCLGKPRAECCVKFLQELNPDVTGEFYSNMDVVYLESFLEERCFSFIICSLPMPNDIFSTLTKHVNKNQIPFVYIHSVGFYSYFRSIIPKTIPLVDTHPDIEATTDLRLLSPWNELSEFSAALTKDIENLSDHEHGHIPYVSLLLHFLEIWKKKYGKLPDSYAEKIEFRKFVAASERFNVGGGEENFQEAIAAVIKTVKAPTLPIGTREVFEYQPKDNEANSSVWIITDAIKKFYEKNNCLPVPGSLPDMKAESIIYVQLQQIYLNKARQDTAEVLQTVRKHPYGKDIEKEEVENFCKNAAHIKLLRALNETTTEINAIARKEFENDESSIITLQPLSLIPIYLAINATSHSLATSTSEIIQKIDKEVSNASSNERVQKAVQEVVRAKGGELHNISAMTGGMVAQEVIKIITRQYIPIDNTCIFDGISSRAQVLRI